MHIHLIPSFWMVVIILAIALRHRRRMEAMRLGLTDRWSERRQERALRRHGRYGEMPTPAIDHREVEDLRERVKVLERIATDGRTGQELAAEIEALRDKPAVPHETEQS